MSDVRFINYLKGPIVDSWSAHVFVHALSAFITTFFFMTCATPTAAQDWPTDWGIDLNIPSPLPQKDENQSEKDANPAANNPNEASPPQNSDVPAQLALQALLTEDGQSIPHGLVWRVYEEARTPKTPSRLLSTHKQTSPVLTLRPGNYAVNVAYGRANLTKRITLRAGEQATEQFVLNAGGLKLVALIGNQQPIENSVTYTVLEGEPDQSGQRAVIISEARPGLIIRLNAGIYHVVSRYGDANATIGADVTVEAGKLTVATLSHTAATVTFKLVARPGGEALPQTHWTIETKEGTLVKKSVGALPTHILAPGQYIVTAQNAEHIFKSEFQVHDGQAVSVEVVAQ